MKHLDNIALIILLRLLLHNESLELVAKDRTTNSKNELLYYVNAIKSRINTPQKCLNVNDQNYTITLSIVDRELLNTYLKNYANEFDNGFYTNINSISALKNELIKTRNTRKTVANYPIHNIQFIPYVLSEYYKNEKFIKNISIQTENTEEVAYPIKIYDYFEDGEPTGNFYNNYEDYFDWEVCVNLNDYIKSATIKKFQNPQNIKEKKFSKDEKKLFKFLLVSAQNGIFVLTKTELLSYCNKSSFDAIKHRLNNKYNEIYNKDIKLLSYNRTDEQYIISRDILT